MHDPFVSNKAKQAGVSRLRRVTVHPHPPQKLTAVAWQNHEGTMATRVSLCFHDSDEQILSAGDVTALAGGGDGRTRRGRDEGEGQEEHSIGHRKAEDFSSHIPYD
ncbi:unnamed protein product [Gadus morhua 'NCC']